MSVKSRWFVAALGVSAVFAGWMSPESVPMLAPAKAQNQNAAASDRATNDEIERAIKLATQHLLSLQNKQNFSWENVQHPNKSGKNASVDGDQWGGMTAMATYALLAAGQSPQDPRIRGAVDWLIEADIEGTYALGFRGQVWQYLPQSERIAKAARKDSKLAKLNMRSGNNDGLFRYGPDREDFDHSASNYGALALWGAAQVDLEVDPRLWDRMDKAWRSGQLPNGAWTYTDAGESKGASFNMTTAGVATLYITADRKSLGQVECKGNPRDENIERGVKWIVDYLNRNNASEIKMYGWYNLERIGTASGRKYFGSLDWYQAGATYIARRLLKNNGAWDNNSTSVTDVSWAIVFLSKGRAPIMFNKLEYMTADKKPGNWNQRPRDVANLSHYVSKAFERPLNWQIVNLSAPVDELHDAPVLYISGNQKLDFSAEDVAKLRQYVEQGGLVLGVAECGGPGAKAFATSFEALGRQMFPAYEFIQLPQTHRIFNIQFKREVWKKANQPTLEVKGLSNGSRELMLLIPQGDPGSAWQAGSIMGRESLHQLPTNIYLYAIEMGGAGGRELRYKGDSHVLQPRPGASASRDVSVARLKYTGNWNPEPYGWQRLAVALKNAGTANLTTKEVELGKDDLSKYKFAHLTGTQKMTFSDAQKKALHDFVNAGGTLIIDATGGSDEFAESVREQLKLIFGSPAAALSRPLPTSHPLYNPPGSAEPITIRFRRFAANKLGENGRLPRIAGMELNGRTAIFFSAEDLSTALVGHLIDGVVGYEPASATAIVTGILTRGPATPATRPATLPATMPATKPATKPAK